MVGHPTETDEDLCGIAEIARNIREIAFKINGKAGGRFRVTVSVSTFVPKPFTPFQWEPQDRPEELIRKHNYLKQRLKMKDNYASSIFVNCRVVNDAGEFLGEIGRAHV